VFCRILGSGAPDDATYILWRDELTMAILNAYPYTSGHLMVMPVRHVGSLAGLTDAEADGVFAGVRRAAAAVEAAYEPEGMNVGINLGKAGGAGIPGHLHVHVVPRWNGDTNFMTAVAETRVLPESLQTTWSRIKERL
jgi:ATP adenylyltransferase